MRKVLIVLVALFVLLAGGAAAAAWRYDAARDDRLAEGIVLADVDVGGMRVAEARAVLEQAAAALAEPIMVRYRHGQFVFSPTDAKVSTNLDALLAEALAASRDGNFLTRAFRDVTGGRLGKSLSLDVSYTEGAVRRFVRSVERRGVYVPVVDPLWLLDPRSFRVPAPRKQSSRMRESISKSSKIPTRPL